MRKTIVVTLIGVASAANIRSSAVIAASDAKSEVVLAQDCTAYPGSTPEFSTEGEEEICKCVADPRNQASKEAWTCPPEHELEYDAVRSTSVPNEGECLFFLFLFFFFFFSSYC
jgi:hypothetical protein